MSRDITNRIYTEYFNIIRMEFDLFNTILSQQQASHRNMNRIISNYQNYILYPSILAENRDRTRNNVEYNHRRRRREWTREFYRNNHAHTTTNETTRNSNETTRNSNETTSNSNNNTILRDPSSNNITRNIFDISYNNNFYIPRMPPILPPPPPPPTTNTSYWGRNRTRYSNTTYIPPTIRRTPPLRFPGNNLQRFINTTLHSGNTDQPASIEQVLNNTTSYLWQENTNNNQIICPISRLPFDNTTYICKINHCGHIFTHGHLLKWFSKNSTCPICRFNIADASNNSVTENQTNSTNSTTRSFGTSTTPISTSNIDLSFINTAFDLSSNTIDASNNIFNNLTENITTLLRNEIQQLDPSQNSILSAEISFNIPQFIPNSNVNTERNTITAFSEEEEEDP